MNDGPQERAAGPSDDAGGNCPAPSPRAFAVTTGFVYQCVGFVFLLSVCALWSLTTYFSPPPASARGHWLDDLATALVTIGSAATLVGGVGLVGVGVGLQGERPSSGVVAAWLTGLLSLVFWTIFGLYCVETESWIGRLISFGLAGLTTSLFGLGVRSAILLRRFPPPADQNVVTDEELDEIRSRRSPRP